MTDTHQTNGKHYRNWFTRITHFLSPDPQNRHELANVIAEARNREIIDRKTEDMMESILKFSDMRVRDLMIPRSQMITIEVKQSIQDFLPIVLESAHSRFPVVNEDKDHIEGILLAKDLLAYGFNETEQTLTLSELLRPAIVVSESKRIDALLLEFRQNRYHMAIVVDEYGGVSGLITIEDVLETIVGDIEDEHDDNENPINIRKISKNNYSILGLTPLDEFNQYFNSKFSDADTIGGIALRAFGHMPTRGETIIVEGYQFKVANADARRIIALQITVPKKKKQFISSFLD